MKIKRFMLGPIAEDGYVIYHRRGGACLIIDPGYEAPRYIDFLSDRQLKPEAVILTHLHHDHTGQAEVLSEIYDDIPIMMHEMDRCLYRGRVDRPLRDGDFLSLEEEKLRVIHVPGHTPGGVALLSEKSRVCFTGDTLFDTDIGRTDLEGGSEQDMKVSLRRLDQLLPNDITIYPGHEGCISMKLVRRYNLEFLRALED